MIGPIAIKNAAEDIQKMCIYIAHLKCLNCRDHIPMCARKNQATDRIIP